MRDGVFIAEVDRDSTERFNSLRRALGVRSFGLNQITLEPGQRGRIHRHQRQEEVYLVIEGTLSLLLDGQETELEVGALARIEPSVRRQLLNRGPGRLILIAIGGEGDHQGRDGEAFGSWDQELGVSPQELELPADLPLEQQKPRWAAEPKTSDQKT